jgi:hypothetical protein
MRSPFLVGLLSGAVGGLTSAYLVGHLAAAAAAREDAVSAHRIQLVDSAGSSRAKEMLAELKFLSEHLPRDRQTRSWCQSYRKEYESTD